jgi:hypothetical protein
VVNNGQLIILVMEYVLTSPGSDLLSHRCVFSAHDVTVTITTLTWSKYKLAKLTNAVPIINEAI